MNDLDLDPLRSKWEVIDAERDKTWTVETAFTVTAEDGEELTIPAGFEHDRYTTAPDTNDNTPAVAHDFCYSKIASGRKWDSGKKISRKSADKLLRFLMEQSDDPQTKERAAQYYRGVRLYGWPTWHLNTLKARIASL